MKKSEEILLEFYKKKRKQKKLEYEVTNLEEISSSMSRYLQSGQDISKVIKQRLEKTDKKILDKQMEINDIKYETAEIEFIINEALDKEERAIIDLKYNKNKDYKTMVDKLNISKSTISRRLVSILNTINEELDIDA